MNRIDEILSNIELDEDSSNKLTDEEKKRIMHNITEKLSHDISHKRKKPIKVIMFAAVIMIIMTGTVLAMKSYIDKNLSEQLGIADEKQEEFENAVDTPLCSTSHDGIRVDMLQTFSDTKTLFAVFTVTTSEDIIYSDEYYFCNAKVFPENPEIYTPFAYNVELLEENERTKKYLATVSGTSIDLKSGKFFLHLGNLCRYVKDENGQILKDENGIEITETVIEGSWDLEWEYDSNVKTEIKEINTSVEVPLSYSIDGKQTITVKKITLSPLSVSVEFTFDGSYIEDHIGGAVIGVNLKDGTKITSTDIPRNAQYSSGHNYYRFDKIIDINNIESVSVEDVVIPVDN